MQSNRSSDDASTFDSVAAAAASGNHRATLVAMRDKLAADMDEAPPAVVAQIAGRLAAILADIDAIEEPGKVSALDELDKRRRDKSRGPATGTEPPPITAKRQRRS